jgi:hypothetical protein
MALKDWKKSFPIKFGYSWVRLDNTNQIGVMPVWENGVQVWTVKGNKIPFGGIKNVSTQKKAIYLAKKYMEKN